MPHGGHTSMFSSKTELKVLTTLNDSVVCDIKEMGHSVMVMQTLYHYIGWQCLTELNPYLPYNPEITPLGIHHGRQKLPSQRFAHHGSFIPISQNGNNIDVLK